MMNYLKTMIKGSVCLCVLLLCVLCFASCGGNALEVQDLTWGASGPLPDAADFVVDLPDGYRARYAEEYTYSTIGSYEVDIIISDALGFQTRKTVNLHLIVDKTPPTLQGLKDLLVKTGGSVSYLSGITATDNCGGEIEIEVDTFDVDLKKEGVYPVYYTATDAAGNSTTVRMSVTVYRQEITEEMLWKKIDAVIAKKNLKDLDREEQVREIHEYVYFNVSYNHAEETPGELSDKSNWVRAAYEGLTTERGDCYTYFALSKAFFERLGIENMDVERAQSAVAKVDQRHFWNFVNIGTAEAPKWYHFDACQIDGKDYPWGCLVTDAQLADCNAEIESANGTSNYFYEYDRATIPASATETITKLS